MLFAWKGHVVLLSALWSAVARALTAVRMGRALAVVVLVVSVVVVVPDTGAMTGGGQPLSGTKGTGPVPSVGKL